jgi:hypothetical protein
MGLGALFVVIVILVSSLLGYAAFQGRGMDRQSKAYADAAIVAVTSDWDLTQLEDRASPALMKILVNQNFGQKLFTAFMRLGKLTKYDGSKGQSSTTIGIGEPSSTTAAYTAHAEFANGQADIDINLVKTGDQWLIYGFHVDSPVLLP